MISARVAHRFSPLGGGGLACAPSPSCPEALLGSYETERRPVARRVRALTDALFWAESARGPIPSLLRGTVGPVAAPVLPWLLSRRRILAAGFRLLSRLDAGYGGVPGLEPCRRHLRVGARLPDASVVCEGRAVRLHELTAQPGFHVLAGPGPRLDEPGLAARVDVHRLARTPGRYLLGLRPDGYLGFCGGRTMSRDSALGSPAQPAPRPRSISADRRFSSRARARSRCRVAGSGIEHTTALITDLGENVAGFGSWSRSGPVNSRPPSTRC